MNIIDFKDGMKIAAPMVVANMPNDYYHNNTPEFLSKSGLDLFDRSPAHLYCAKPRETTRAMELGTAFHTAILEPDLFESDYMILKDVKDRRASEYKEAIKVFGSERVLVSHESDNILSAQQALSLNADYRAMMDRAHNIELSFFGKCPETGALIKCRFDYLSNDGHAVDLKTTLDIRIDAFSRALLNYRYHVQHAFYSHVYFAVTGEHLQAFDFLAIERESPNSNQLFHLCEETKKIGRDEMMRNLIDYAKNSDVTAGIANAATVISLPMWYLNSQLIEEIG